MDADLDTLVTALHVEIDDLIERPCGRGRRPLLSHAELLCLAVMQVLLRYPSERHWLRYANKHLRGAAARGRPARTRGPPPVSSAPTRRAAVTKFRRTQPVSTSSSKRWTSGPASSTAPSKNKYTFLIRTRTCTRFWTTSTPPTPWSRT
ncbi:hypothetical protein AB0M46_34220 [Dactylosporangium sp. NPDC051485]|uniref:hypothetical protein n=1 Tax=Dactylosporangium sp. NPDC051485 TaxID=3154846 RepID=UPI00342B9871